MLAKITSKNQITLPKTALAQLPPAEYFDVTVVNAQIVLTPVRVERAGDAPVSADAVRDKLAALGITPADLDDALAWARRD